MTKKKTGVQKAVPIMEPQEIENIPIPESDIPIPEIPEISIESIDPEGTILSSLPVGARFEYEGQLYRKAFKVRPDKEVGQELKFTRDSGATLVPGIAKSFDPNIMVKRK